MQNKELLTKLGGRNDALFEAVFEPKTAKQMKYMDVRQNNF